MQPKKNLTRAFISTVLLIGSLELTAGIPGRAKYNYSKLENEAYNYVDKFSRKVPKEFVKENNIYHDSSLTMEFQFLPDVESGKGRIVFHFDEFTTFMKGTAAGYTDANEYKSFQSAKDPNKLESNIFFVRTADWEGLEEEFVFDDMLILNKGKNLVLYIKKDNQWKKGFCEVRGTASVTYEEYYDSIASIMSGKETIPKEQVQRYIDLSNRLENTYFKERQ